MFITTVALSYTNWPCWFNYGKAAGQSRSETVRVCKWQPGCCASCPTRGGSQTHQCLKFHLCNREKWWLVIARWYNTICLCQVLSSLCALKAHSLHARHTFLLVTLPELGTDCQKCSPSLCYTGGAKRLAAVLRFQYYNQLTLLSAVFNWTVSELKLQPFPGQIQDSLSSLALVWQACLNHINHSCLWKIGHNFKINCGESSYYMHVCLTVSASFSFMVCLSHC